MAKTKVKITASTNIGLVRTNNEDNFIVCPDLEKNEWLIPQTDDFIDLGKYGALLVVADGMGGANAGEVASEIAINTAKSIFTIEALEKMVYSDKDITEFLENIVIQADQSIKNKAKEDESTKGMGTTIVMAWVYNGAAYITWCGDSRCYVYNNNVGIQRLSKDHSFVQNLVDKGELDPELAFDHPYSNVITRCLGDSDSRAIPESRKYDMSDGDILLLCTDGLCGLCRDDEILNVMSETHSKIQECKTSLIEAALEAGGHDNVTIALCSVHKDKEEDSTTDEITSTIKSTPGRKKHIVARLFLLLLLVIAGLFLWDSSREIIIKYIEQIWAKIYTYCEEMLK